MGILKIKTFLNFDLNVPNIHNKIVVKRHGETFSHNFFIRSISKRFYMAAAPDTRCSSMPMKTSSLSYLCTVILRGTMILRRFRGPGFGELVVYMTEKKSPLMAWSAGKLRTGHRCLDCRQLLALGKALGCGRE